MTIVYYDHIAPQQWTPAQVYLEQIIALDGYDATITRETTILNGSHRRVGIAYEISPETAQFIQEAIAA